MGVGEGENEDEFLITRLEAFEPALNIINSYGEQRSTAKGEVEKKWSRLRREMESIRLKGEYCCLGGDLNKLLGSDQLGVPGTSPYISLGGRLLREPRATGDWLLVNGLGNEVVEGGPYTRKDPATGNMSCLDLFVVSIELRPYISSLLIDKERKFTPYRAVKEKKKFKLIYSDHFASILTLKNLPRKKEGKAEKQRVWNLAKENGWKEYKNISDKYGDAIEKLVEDESISIQEAMDKISKIEKKIKFKAFGKITITNKKKEKIENKEEEGGTEEERAKLVLEDQEQEAEREVEKIKSTKKGKCGKSGRK